MDRSFSSPSGRRSLHGTPQPSQYQQAHNRSPSRSSFRTSILLEPERNSELSHRDALAAAHAEHERIRTHAIQAYELHELEQEASRIQEDQKKEEARLKAEAALVAEEKRLRALKQQQVPKLPPEPVAPKPETTPAPPPEPKPLPAPAPTPPSQTQPGLPGTLNGNGVTSNSVDTPNKQTPSLNDAPANLFSTTAPKPPLQPLQQAPATKPIPTPIQTQTLPPSTVRPPPKVDKYIQIHQQLKKLRKFIDEQARSPGSPLKGKLGEMRREIRKSMGQLTGGRGANALPVSKVISILQESLANRDSSAPIDVSLFVVDSREPDAHAALNTDQIPSLFLYLLNIFSKAIISQFINECGANPKAADPIGVVTAQIFSHKDFQWRGKSLIDILMAKFRIVCPVLFGFRGNDKTERGRLAIGWRKDGGGWMPEQMHNDRMAGLGAGFASVSLRDFSKASKQNPYPPTNYWIAMAAIINTPATETSNTQYVVLKSMIDGFEQRFLTFYGNAAMAALRLAMLEFPKKAPPKSAAAAALQVLGDVLKKNVGLVL